jgi:hypothetical protein
MLSSVEAPPQATSQSAEAARRNRRGQLHSSQSPKSKSPWRINSPEAMVRSDRQLTSSVRRRSDSRGAWLR